MARPERWGKPDPEKLDDTPIEMPLGSVRPTPLTDIIAKMVRQAVLDETGEEFETPTEADDFEEENPDTLDLSPYEFTDLQAEEAIPEQEAAEQLEPTEEVPVIDEPETGDPPDQNAEDAG